MAEVIAKCEFCGMTGKDVEEIVRHEIKEHKPLSRLVLHALKHLPISNDDKNDTIDMFRHTDDDSDYWGYFSKKDVEEQIKLCKEYLKELRKVQSWK